MKQLLVMVTENPENYYKLDAQTSGGMNKWEAAGLLQCVMHRIMNGTTIPVTKKKRRSKRKRKGGKG